MATCPNCKESFELSPRLLERECVSLHMTWEGDMVEAKTIGGMIENTRKLLASVVKDAGRQATVGINGIDWDRNEATIHFVIALARGGDK